MLDPNTAKARLRLFKGEQLKSLCKNLHLHAGTKEECIATILTKLSPDEALVAIEEIREQEVYEPLRKEIKELTEFKTNCIFRIGVVSMALAGIAAVIGWDYSTLRTKTAEATKEVEKWKETADKIDKDMSDVARIASKLTLTTANETNEIVTQGREKSEKQLKSLEDRWTTHDKQLVHRLIALLMVEADGVMVPPVGSWFPTTSETRKAVLNSRISLNEKLRNSVGADFDAERALRTLETIFEIADKLSELNLYTKIPREQTVKITDEIKSLAEPLNGLEQTFKPFEDYLKGGDHLDKFGVRVVAFKHYALGSASIMRYHMTGRLDEKLLETAADNFRTSAHTSAALRWSASVRLGSTLCIRAEHKGIKDPQKLVYFREARTAYNEAAHYPKPAEQMARVTNNLAHVNYQEAILLKNGAEPNVPTEHSNELLEAAWKQIEDVHNSETQSAVEAESTWGEIYCTRITFGTIQPTYEDWQKIAKSIRQAGAKDVYRRLLQPNDDLFKVDQMKPFQVLLDKTKFKDLPEDFDKQIERLRAEVLQFTKPIEVKPK